MKKYKIQNIDFLSDNTCRVRTDRPSIKIRAGQCFNVGIPNSGINREYSMYSGANDEYLEFLIRVVEGGCVSPFIAQLKVGDHLEIDGPYGEFCLREPVSEKQHYLFIASGTGIAPFRSFVRTYQNLDYTILHGIRHAQECYDAKDYPDDRYISCISRNSGGTSQRLTDYLRNHPPSPSSVVYLCGNRNMIVDAFEILREHGVPGDNLFTEVFF